MFDVRSTSNEAVVGQVYRGAPTDAQVRKFAHQFADEIISRLSGGFPGVGSTQIAFMQLAPPAQGSVGDGLRRRQPAPANLFAFHLFHAALVSRRLAHRLHLFRSANSVVSARSACTRSTPAKSSPLPATEALTLLPHGLPTVLKVMFSSSMQGNPALYVSDASGNRPKRLTFSNSGADTSPAWNPKTMQTVVFVSDRGGVPQLYMMNADALTPKLDLGDKGYVVDPAWAPNGQLLAFPGAVLPAITISTSWTSAPATSSKSRATPAATNAPVWARWPPLVFESTRTGTRQIGPCSPTAASLTN